MRSVLLMRACAGALALSLGTATALADEPLPEALSGLLQAAAQDSPQRFAQAVRLVSLTHTPEQILAASEAFGQGEAARAALGMDPAPDGEEEPAELAEVEAEVEEDEDYGLINGVVTAPWWLARLAAAGQSDLWNGRVSLGVRFDSGNTDREDYTLGVQVRRELAQWGFRADIDYAYSEVNDVVGRDNLRTRLRGEREAGERFTYFAAGDYEQDRLSSFDWTGFLGLGVGYRVLINPARTWIVRVSPGARFVGEPGNGTQTNGALDLGSDIALQLTETLSFTSESSLLLGENSRADQLFGLNSALSDLWSLRLQYRYRHEFDPNPGFLRGDTRTDISIVREF
ncbi:DUF481 domain-containing protein [Glycocaulis sp.]